VAGGALDETFPVKFLSVFSDTAGGTGSIPLAGLHGTFSGTLPTSGGAAPGSAGNILLALRVSSFGFAGELYVPGVAPSDGYGLAFAHFPADDFCGVFDFNIAKNESVHGLSISGALDSLNAASPVVRNGNQRGTLNLAFESLVDRACTTAGTLSFPARATLSSSDGTVDGSIDVTVAMQEVSGKMTVGASRSLYTIDAAEAARAAAADYAIRTPLDF